MRAILGPLVMCRALAGVAAAVGGDMPERNGIEPDACVPETVNSRLSGRDPVRRYLGLDRSRIPAL